jgi:hypothetical protein
LFSSGKGGKIYQWSMQTKSIYEMIHCPGAFEVNSLATYNNTLAAGTQTGIVNIFQIDSSTLKIKKNVVKVLALINPTRKSKIYPQPSLK